MQVPLEQAFERFEQVAATLTAAHASLGDRAAALENELAATREHLNAVIDSVDAGVAVVRPNGRIERSNLAFRQMGLADGDDAATLITSLRPLLETPGTRSFSVERAQHSMELLIHARHLENSSTSVILTATDITDLRRQSKLDNRRSRLESLGRMAAELAHEIRNPLGAIRLHAGLLHTDVTDPDQCRLVEHLLTSTARLESTITNMLQFATGPSPNLQRLDLTSLLREVAQSLESAFTVAQVNFDLRIDTEPLYVEGDRESLRQVFLNLIDNALKACSKGKLIEVSAEVVRDQVAVRIRDTGVGIRRSDIPRVFDPFFSSFQGGSGLGLAIVHRMVEQHRGDISIESQRGQGTTCCVALPVSEGESV